MSAQEGASLGATQRDDWAYASQVLQNWAAGVRGAGATRVAVHEHWEQYNAAPFDISLEMEISGREFIGHGSGTTAREAAVRAIDALTRRMSEKQAEIGAEQVGP